MARKRRLAKGGDSQEMEERETENDKGDGRSARSQETSRMVKETETVIFIPSTPGSQLKNILQKQDSIITTAMGSPRARFVERAGVTIMEELGSNNPWSTEWYCPRKDCLPCQGRAFLAKEEEEEAIKLVTGEGKGNPDPSRKPDRKSVPSLYW